MTRTLRYAVRVRAGRLISVLVLSSFALPGVARAADPAPTSAPSCAPAYESAQRLRQESKLVEARRELLSCGQDACPAAIRHDCVGWLTEVDATMPTLSVHVRGSDGCDRPDATVSIDGVAVANAANGRPMSVNPGPHVVVSLLDGVPQQETIVVPISVNRVLALASPGAAKSCIHDSPFASEPKKTPTAPISEGRPTPTVVYVLGGLGIAAVGVGTGFAISGWAQKGQLDDCKGHCSDSSVDSTQSAFRVGDVALGIGIVSLAAATILYLYR